MLQRLMLAAVLVLLAIACAIVTQSRTLTGKVVSIADGDTLTLLVDQEQIRVRLEGIDAPERSQSFGTKAGEALGDLVYAKTVTVRSIGTDRYGRTLGRIFVRSDAGETIDVNARLVEQGFAWWYREYSDDKMLIAADKAAREARRGPLG